jgi:hypothetical protein
MAPAPEVPGTGPAPLASSTVLKAQCLLDRGR